MTLDTCVALVAVLVILLLETMAWYRELERVEKQTKAALQSALDAIKALEGKVQKQQTLAARLLNENIRLSKRVKELEETDG